MTMKIYVENVLKAINYVDNNFINVIIWYIILCLIVYTFIFTIKIVIYFVTSILEKMINKIGILVLGKNHEKSTKYKLTTLWFIKFNADVCYFLDWMRDSIFKTYTVIGYSYAEQGTMLKKVRIISFSTLIKLIRNFCKSFFSVNLLHIFLLSVVICGFYYEKLIILESYLRKFILQSDIQINDIIDIFELLSIVCIVLFIVLDVRHKMNGYTALREERFREIIILEEKMLHILHGMSYYLGKNIEVICKQKERILLKGASNLCGKQCYLKRGELKIYDNKYMWNNTMCSNTELFYELNNMNDIFKELADLETEFKESSLRYSNIYSVDYKTMLFQIIHVWWLGNEKEEYKRMEFFCKDSMDKWYNNWFVKPVIGNNNEISYYLLQDTQNKILEASAMLDYELQRAFELELYIEKYRRKMTKRMKKISRFSRLGIF